MSGVVYESNGRIVILGGAVAGVPESGGGNYSQVFNYTSFTTGSTSGNVGGTGSGGTINGVDNVGIDGTNLRI